MEAILGFILAAIGATLIVLRGFVERTVREYQGVETRHGLLNREIAEEQQANYESPQGRRLTTVSIVVVGMVLIVAGLATTVSSL